MSTQCGEGCSNTPLPEKMNQDRKTAVGGASTRTPDAPADRRHQPDGKGPRRDIPAL